MAEPTCPFCGSSVCEVEPNPNFVHYVNCKSYKISLLIENETFEYWEYESVLFNKIIVCILRFLLLSSKHVDNRTNKIWRFYYDDKSRSMDDLEGKNVNIYNHIHGFPCNAIEQMEQGLLGLGKSYPSLGKSIYIDYLDYAACYVTGAHGNNSFSRDEIAVQLSGCYSVLAESGYLSKPGNHHYQITSAGWEKIRELQKAEYVVNQGFIAMKFATETDSICSAFMEAIEKCGYAVCRMDKLHHNGQIVPEMLYQIKRSKFLVVDVTHANLGAYYEAGYGEALEKEVIVCCKKDVLNSADRKEHPHFDIAQKSMVVWNDEQDLVERLEARIEATVGRARQL